MLTAAAHSGHAYSSHTQWPYFQQPHTAGMLKLAALRGHFNTSHIGGVRYASHSRGVRYASHSRG
eukprot:308633-Chlamydomonas_euryale.AAC.1